MAAGAGRLCDPAVLGRVEGSRETESVIVKEAEGRGHAAIAAPGSMAIGEDRRWVTQPEEFGVASVAQGSMEFSLALAARAFLLAYDAGWEPEFDGRFPERPLPLAVAARFWNRAYWEARAANDGFNQPP